MPITGRHPDWQKIYSQASADQLPWHWPALDPDLEMELDRRAIESGRFLDIGTGAGSQANALANRGFQVTGTDISVSAIAVARTRYPETRFLVDDACRTSLTESFDYAFDRGCLHVLAGEQRQSYIESTFGLLEAQGLLFLKCFSREEGDSNVGPLRFEAEELRKLFSSRFSLESVRSTRYQGSRPHQPLALFAVFRRRTW